jgi:hypothetical protein
VSAVNKHAPGCSACGNALLTVTVTACNALNRPGAIVTIKQGSTTVGSGTTNVNGQATINVGSTGTYTVEVDGGSQFQPYSAPVTVTNAAGTTFYTAGLTPIPGSICVPCCTDPLPTTLRITDPNGTWTLTYTTGIRIAGNVGPGGTIQGGTAANGWVGSYTLIRNASTPNPATFTCDPASATVGARIQLACVSLSGQQRFWLEYQTKHCTAISPAPGYVVVHPWDAASSGTATYNSTQAPVAGSVTCSPLYIGYDFSLSPIGAAGALENIFGFYDNIGRTVPITVTT